MNKIIILFFILIGYNSYSQVKIGNNPNQIDASSILELESSDKVIVITRVTTSQMNAITPLKGALTYNLDDDCIYTYDGTNWKDLCNTSSSGSINVTTALTPPTTNTLGDFWINSSKNNEVNIWDGIQWIPIDTNPKRGNGAPTNITAPNPIAGDIYVNEATGEIYTYNGTTWLNSNTTLNADNGVSIATGNTIQLGGVLIQPTVIETDITNTLSINGLQDGDLVQDDLVTIDRATGQLKKVNNSTVFREEVTEITATNGQIIFTPLISITDNKKVNVYRNGVRIDFTVINPTTIEIEPEAVCYQGDQIRIVQFY